MSNAYDDRRAPVVPFASEPAGGSGRVDAFPPPPAQVLDGVELPAALFTGDPRLQAAFVRLAPSEASFFVARPAAEVIRVCAELTGVESRLRAMSDRYHDTAGGSLFARGVSARLRHYTRHTRPLAFEVIAVSMHGVRDEGGLRARTNEVLVQTFGRTTEEDYARILAQYRHAGLVPVAEVRKTRTAFDLHPFVIESAGGAVAAGADHRGIGDARGEASTTDIGLRVLVDELHGRPFPEPTIVEVEFDPRHRARAHALLVRVGEALGPVVREKARNKIAYLLEGAR
jgi:hypothetical protein